MVEAIEIVGVQRNLAPPTIKTWCRLVVAAVGVVDDRREGSRRSRDAAYADRRVVAMTDHTGNKIRASLVVYDQTHFLHGGPGSRDLRRIVRYTHDHPVYRRMFRSEHTLHGVAGLGALVDVQIDHVQPELEGPKMTLDPGAQQQGRGVGEICVFHRPCRKQSTVPEIAGSLDPRAHHTGLHQGCGEVEAHAAHISFGQRQRGEAGGETIPDDGAVSPTTVAIANRDGMFQ